MYVSRQPIENTRNVFPICGWEVLVDLNDEIDRGVVGDGHQQGLLTIIAHHFDQFVVVVICFVVDFSLVQNGTLKV